MSGQAEIESRMYSVHDLCRKHNVARLWIFGSAVRNDFDPITSDFDFVAEFLPGCSRPWFGEYFELKQDLEILFGRSVDVIGKPASRIENPYLRRSIERDQKLIYGA